MKKTLDFLKFYFINIYNYYLCCAAFFGFVKKWLFDGLSLEVFYKHCAKAPLKHSLKSSK